MAEERLVDQYANVLSSAALDTEYEKADNRLSAFSSALSLDRRDGRNCVLGIMLVAAWALMDGHARLRKCWR